MKDLSNYIESLLDVIKKPCVVKYRDNVYYVDITYDYGNSVNLYRFGDFLINNLVDKTESMLKTYLPEITFNVKVKKINIPAKYQNTYTYVSSMEGNNYSAQEFSSYVVSHYPMTYIDNTN
jgi:hypothetical protein